MLKTGKIGEMWTKDHQNTEVSVRLLKIMTRSGILYRRQEISDGKALFFCSECYIFASTWNTCSTTVRKA